MVCVFACVRGSLRRVVDLEGGVYSQRQVMVRPEHRGGVVTAMTVLPGMELVLAVRQDLDSVVGEGSFERYRCLWDDEHPDSDFSVPFMYSARYGRRCTAVA